MKKRILKSIFITILAAVLLTGCGEAKDAGSAAKTESKGPKRKMIIDTDTGADDASALILAASSDDIDLLGVTVLVGNVELMQGAKNALMALQIAGNDAPVYKGCAQNASGEEIEAYSVYGKDGMGDADLIHPEREAEDEDAISFILDTLNKYPGEVEIVALGPATNIAEAIKRDPETMKKAKKIWSMGTAGLGPGNATPVAEFNVYADPLAYKEMLDSGLDITIVGLDMCGGQAGFTNKQFDELKNANAAGSFITDSFGELRKFYAANGSGDSVMNCDALAMMCVLDPEFVNETVSCHGSCQTQSGETLAQVIFYREGFTYDVASNDFDYNVTLVSDVDGASFFENFLKMIKRI